MKSNLLNAALAFSLFACNQSVFDGNEGIDDGTGPLCAAAQSDIKARFSVDASAFREADSDDDPAWQWVEATCTVDERATSGSSVNLQLRCNGSGKTDVPVGLSFTRLSSEPLAIEQVAKLHLRYSSWGYGHHQVPGQWLALEDSTNGRPLLAAVNANTLRDVSEALVALDLDSSPSACGDPCPTMASGCDEEERLNVQLKVPGGAEAALLDSSKETVTLDGQLFDASIEKATYRSCLNCGSEFVLVIAAR